MSAPTGLLFVDSFDHYNSNLLMQRKWTTVPGAVTFVTGRSGAGTAIQFSLTSGVPLITFGWEYSQLAVGVGYQTTAFANSIIVLKNIPSGYSVELGHVGDGRIKVFIPFGPTSGPLAGFSMSLNTWYFFELLVTLTNPMSYTVRVNGTELATGTLSSPTVTVFPSVSFGGPGGGSSCTIDDVYITDGDLLGDTEWTCIYPNAAGVSAQWTPSPAVANYLNVQEHSPDDFTTFNEGDAITDQDLYNMDNIGLTHRIVGIQALNCATKDASGVASFDGSIRTNATLVQEAEFFPSFGSWLYQRVPYQLNPVTSIAWTAAEINAIQRGALRIS